MKVIFTLCEKIGIFEVVIEGEYVVCGGFDCDIVGECVGFE